MRLSIALLCASSALVSSAALAAQGDSSAPSNAFQLGEIVVTAPVNPALTLSTTTLSSEAIYQFQRPTLDDASNLIPGVNSSNTGGSRNERLIFVRGFNRFQVPLLIDGIRVYLPADNRLDYGRFLTPDIAEIQVAKGYVSVLDGPDGMGGEINLVTRKPTKAFEAEAQATVNGDRDLDYQGYSTFLMAGTRQDKWYAQGSYARNFQDHWDLPGGFMPTATENGGERDLSRTSDWRANAKVGFTPNATDEYALSYTKQEGEKLAPLSTTDPLSIQRFWTWPYWNIASLYFLSSTALGEHATLKTRLYRNTFDNLLSSFDNRNENTQTIGKAFNSYYQDLAYGGSAQLDVKPMDNDTFSLAFHYRRDKHLEWQQSFPSGVTEPKQEDLEDTFNVAAANTVDLTPDLTLSGGVSYDWRDLKRAEDYASNAFVYYPLKNSHALNGQARLAYALDDGSEVHLSVSSRARFPTIFERFSSRFGGAVSNAGLNPERATNYEFGGSKVFGVLHAEGAMFYSHLSDVIVSVPFIYTTCTPAGVCTNNAVTQSRNVGNGNYYGGELSLSAQVLPNLELGGNYTYTHRHQVDPNNAAFRPTDVPTHKGFLYADWTPVERLHVLPTLDLASDRWTVNSAGTRYYRTGSYVSAGLRTDFDVTSGVQIGVGVKNLFDDNYQLVDGFPEPGRSFFVSARARY